MSEEIAVGILNMVITVVIHGCAQILITRRMLALQDIGAEAPLWLDFWWVSAVVIIVFFATLLGAIWWALCYVYLGALPTSEEAMYFSMVTYTTLGYGDITLGEEWRILSAFQAANGVIIAGWSTALVIAVVQRITQARHSALSNTTS